VITVAYWKESLRIDMESTLEYACPEQTEFNLFWHSVLKLQSNKTWCTSDLVFWPISNRKTMCAHLPLQNSPLLLPGDKSKGCNTQLLHAIDQHKTCRKMINIWLCANGEQKEHVEWRIIVHRTGGKRRRRRWKYILTGLPPVLP